MGSPWGRRQATGFTVGGTCDTRWPAACSGTCLGRLYAAGLVVRLGWEKTIMIVPTMLDNKATQILAKSLFKELRGNGYSPNHILGLTTELIDLVTQDLRDANAAARHSDRQDDVRASA